MVPTACPRCARSSETWTFERDQEIAGCPCGEVIPYPFDDAPLEAISKTPKKPRVWHEHARTDGFTATLEPSMRWLWYTVPLLLLLSGWRIALSGAMLGGITGLVLALAAIAGVMGWAIAQSARRWTFSIGNGRFRADARGHSTDIALEDIQRFDVAPRSGKRKGKAADARAFFQLVVSRSDGERVRVPLFVETPDEAQFIAERANTMLASGGRTIAGDYRGQRLRVDEVDLEAGSVAPERARIADELDADVDVEELGTRMERSD